MNEYEKDVAGKGKPGRAGWVRLERRVSRSRFPEPV